jgi:peptidoglycan/xylan/chitin deacetylase (PgdA/CDA1 family)
MFARAGASLLLALVAGAIVQGSTETQAGTGRTESKPPVRSLRLPSPRREWQAYPPALPAAYIPLGRDTLRVPILMYHYIRINPVPQDGLGADLSVTPEDFGAQLDWLDRNGYHPVDLNDVRAYLEGRATLPSRPVVLTFDDGYADLYTAAYPLLKQHRFKAVAYIVSGFVGSGRNVSPEQVREMDRNGIEIASHTFSHADLGASDPARLAMELGRSRADLEALVGHPVLDFCYPYGHFNDAAVQAIQRAGYLTATTTQPGLTHSLGDRYLWTRIRVRGGEPLGAFIASLGEEEPYVTPPAPEPLRELPATLPDYAMHQSLDLAPRVRMAGGLTAALLPTLRA